MVFKWNTPNEMKLPQPKVQNSGIITPSSPWVTLLSKLSLLPSHQVLKTSIVLFYGDICQLLAQPHNNSDKNWVKKVILTALASFLLLWQTPKQKATHERKEFMWLTILGCSPSFQGNRGQNSSRYYIIPQSHAQREYTHPFLLACLLAFS